MGNAYKILFGKREVKIYDGRSRRKWEDNIKNDFEAIGRSSCFD
jgi:hypothetical protein